MKINKNKISTMYSAIINGETYKYGWYDSGRAFVAHYDVLLNTKEAIDLTRPHDYWRNETEFIKDGYIWRRTIDGAVRCLIATYNK